MKRDLYSKLLEWKASSDRKPLVLRGARQVGKTYILKAFGSSEFEQTLYINFEESPTIKKIFETDLDPRRILQDLSIYFNVNISASSTLIFFDEIQECPNALTSLKYFQEQASEYYIVSAGSLLGIKLSKAKGFPVGKVNFLTLYPCNFFEFLDAIGKSKLRLFLDDIKVPMPISEAVHEQLIGLLRYYYYVGGMPEAVRCFSSNSDLNDVRRIHSDILDAYLLDFSKHAPSNDIMKIAAVWRSIPAQLAKENKKFMYSVIDNKARSRIYEDAIHWLNDAGLIHQSYCVSVPRLPLDSYSNKNIFKVFMLDVGLLSTLSQLSAKTILNNEKLFVEFKGALTENFVAQELKASLDSELYYWTSEGKAEIDFMIPFEGEIYPLEIKSGKGSKNKSLTTYVQKYHPRVALRASLSNLKKDNDFCNYPLYLISKIPIEG
jgi:uncharacterized protein